MQELGKRIADKLLSARFILAVFGAFAFLWCVVNRQLEAATITAILMMIFKEYFGRSDRGGPSKPA